MGFQNKAGIRYITFESLAAHGVPHGVFMRHGGVSPEPFHSLNLGGSNGDARANVIENRRRIFECIERPVESLYDVWQVHSDAVISAVKPRPLDQDQLKADALLTNCKSVTLFMRFADCVPIFLYDPVHRVVGMAHAGWQGTVKQILPKMIARMQRVYSSRPEDILSGIGPSICSCCYTVREDVSTQIERSMGEAGRACIEHREGRIYLDLQRANALQLQASGVKNIEFSGICTACHPEDWFSHRAENGSTGRLGALIAL